MNEDVQQDEELPDASDWLTRKQASTYLRRLGLAITPKTLANMAGKNNAGGGPPFTRSSWLGVRYLKKDLQEWAQGRVERVK